jgi:Domain of unknown function (DUF4383)
MTFAQRLAQIFGWGFIVVGIAGFFASGVTMTADHMTAPKLLGIFPVNLVHNLVHLLFGAWGVASSRSLGATRAFLAGAGIIYLVLAAVGYLSPNGFGLVPLGGADIGLHVFLALALLLSRMLARTPDRPATVVVEDRPIR